MILITGCENQDEVVQDTNVVKAYKIEKKTKKTLTGKGDTPVLSTDAKESDPVTKEKLQEKKADKIPPTVSEPPLSKTTAAEVIVNPENESVLSTDALDINEEERQEIRYNAEGRIDPFAPLFKKATEVVEKYDKPQSAREARRGRLTALEKLDLSQLKLTGILYMPSAQRSMAMVEETTGKGHVIKKGTYIGVNSGRVVEIQKNIVVIEEEVENYMGDIVVRKRELKLQKPLGER